MNKLKIFRYHSTDFITGSIGLVAYIFIKLSSLKGGAALGGVVAMPVIAVVYVVGFGILCVISLAVWFLISYFRNK